MNARRQLVLAVVLCAAGAIVSVTAAGRPWATVRAQDSITPFSLAVSGRDLSGVGVALGWAGLAGLAALFATRGWPRAVVGLLLAGFGAGIVITSVTATGRGDVLDAAGDRAVLLRLGAHPAVDLSAWWAVSLAGGALLVAAGLLTLVYGRRWPGMSTRYEGPGSTGGTAPRAPAPDDASSLWKSLDRGEDPTLSETKEH